MQAEREERITYQAQFDELTGLPNRLLGLERLANAIGRAEEQNTAVSLLVIDLNSFAEIGSSLGHDIGDAYRRTLRSAGRAVTLTGLTLSAGVLTWMWSPLKFQVDMGILLLFIFLWNMVGALTLLPALAVFLLGRKSGETEDASAGSDDEPIPVSARLQSRSTLEPANVVTG